MLRHTTTLTGFSGAPGYSTLYFRGTEPGEAVAANAAVDAFWVDLATAVNNDLFVAGPAEVEVVNGVTGQLEGIHAVTPFSRQPGVAAERLADATQGLLRWRTGFFVAGREVRGRMYIPCPLEQRNVGGQPDATWRTAVQDAGDTLIAAMGAGNELVVWSRTHGAEGIVLTCNPWNQWAVLRTRRD